MEKLNNYLDLVRKFKRENSSRFAEDVEEECLLMFLEFVLREIGDLGPRIVESGFGNNICTDSECYCGKYTKGDVMINCDGGCMYPGV